MSAAARIMCLFAASLAIAPGARAQESAPPSDRPEARQAAPYASAAPSSIDAAYAGLRTRAPREDHRWALQPTQLRRAHRLEVGGWTIFTVAGAATLVGGLGMLKHWASPRACESELACASSGLNALGYVVTTLFTAPVALVGLALGVTGTRLRRKRMHLRVEPRVLSESASGRLAPHGLTLSIAMTPRL
jgi:hypothetical protein